MANHAFLPKLTHKIQCNLACALLLILKSKHNRIYFWLWGDKSLLAKSNSSQYTKTLFINILYWALKYRESIEALRENLECVLHWSLPSLGCQYKAYLSSLVWQLSAALSRLTMSSSLPYGRFRPSEEVTTIRPYWAGFTHSTPVLKIDLMRHFIHVSNRLM